MKRTNNEFIDEVAEIVAPMLKQYDFERKTRKNFEKIVGNSIFIYKIGVFKKHGEFYLSLGFGVKNKPLMKKVNKILEKVCLEEYNAASLDDEEINSILRNKIKNDAYIFHSYPSIWRNFRKEEESFEAFWTRMRIFIEGVKFSITELDNWYEQLQETVDIVGKFSSAIVDNQWIIDNTGFPALYMLKKEGVDEETFEKGLKKAREIISLKYKIEPFLRHLDNVDFSDDK